MVNYSCLPGWTSDDNLRLLLGFPCNDVGRNPALPPKVRHDLDGVSRFIDDADTRDLGFGMAPLVDLGAYERGKWGGTVFLGGPLLFGR